MALAPCALRGAAAPHQTVAIGLAEDPLLPMLKARLLPGTTTMRTLQTRMPMAPVTTWTTALGNTTSAGFAMGQAQCMPAAVQAFQKGIAIATATKKMRWAFAVAIALPTKMRMASVTT